MSGRVNGEVNLCELSSITAISSSDHKMKFSPVADRSMSDDHIGDSIMIAQPYTWLGGGRFIFLLPRHWVV